jgi:hypothetical protein
VEEAWNKVNRKTRLFIEIPPLYSPLNRSTLTALTLLLICIGCDNNSINSSSHPPDEDQSETGEDLDQTLEIGTNSPDGNSPNDLTSDLDDISSSEEPDTAGSEVSDHSWEETAETRSFDSLENWEESPPDLLIEQGDSRPQDITETTHITYEEETANFANPERGMYHYTEVNLNYFEDGALERTVLEQYRQEENITLILRIFNIGAFVTTELSEEVLQGIESDFATLREAGLKAIVRFKYTDDASPPYGDASPERVLSHIEQLKPLLQENADLILTLQAGFIGAWGEWYYTDHWGDWGTWSDEDETNRKHLVDALLDALPPERSVQLRTPHYRMTLYGDEHGCMDGSDQSRIGHHNDCFLASDSDFGTYMNPAFEYPWLNEDTRCTSMGGETCAVSGERSQCETAIEELTLFHWTYLNTDYHPLVLADWESGGCMEEIQRQLGYRFVLEEATLTSRSAPGTTLNVSITLHNDGYAAPVNPRDLFLVLTSEESTDRWQIKLMDSPTSWLTEEGPVILSTTVGLPEDMPTGAYTWHLHLPDPFDRLHKNPFYAIRFANKNIWDEITGFNGLGVTLHVEEGDGLPYTGESWFAREEE